MKNRIKKIVLLCVASIIIMLGLFMLMTGGKRGDVYLAEYSVSEDGSTLTMNVGVSSSMGFVRTMKVKKGEDGNRYITFYSTFGLNSRLGAKGEFAIEIDPSCDKIYFNKGYGEYRLVLQKDKDTKEWERIRQTQ